MITFSNLDKGEFGSEAIFLLICYDMSLQIQAHWGMFEVRKEGPCGLRAINNSWTSYSEGFFFFFFNKGALHSHTAHWWKLVYNHSQTYWPLSTNPIGLRALHKVTSMILIKERQPLTFQFQIVLEWPPLLFLLHQRAFMKKKCLLQLGKVICMTKVISHLNRSSEIQLAHRSHP